MKAGGKMKRRGTLQDGAFVYRTTIGGAAGSDEIQIEVFRSKEDMENNASPYRVLTSLEDLLDFNE